MAKWIQLFGSVSPQPPFWLTASGLEEHLLERLGPQPERHALAQPDVRGSPVLQDALPVARPVSKKPQRNALLKGVVVADDAAAYLPESGGLRSGTYKPTNYSETPDNMPAPAPTGPFGDSLAIFKGQPANGSWALYVSDAGTGFRRRFESGWSLSITTAGP